MRKDVNIVKKVLFTVLFMAMLWCFSYPCSAASRIFVVATTTDLADFARAVGGTHVEVYSIAKGTEDPHSVEPKPSHILKLKKASLYLVIGMDVEIGYSPVLEKGAGRPDLMYGGENYIDCSQNIRALEVPDKVDRAKGDIHPEGNPHYLTDPHNALIVVDTIAKALKSRFPEYAEDFEKNRDAYSTKLRGKLKEWDSALSPFNGTKVVSYHRLWSYLFRRYHFNLVGTIEPVPGIAPSAAHISKLINTMKAQKCRFIITATYYERKVPDSIASETGGKVVVLPITPGAVKEAPDYISMMDYVVNALVNAFKS